ncbi:DUF6454 family protein [Motilibacter aurantiacus]|uniref:DUF6454 family protein n=1 Tax=Motilibacter aurantiacus TaxID=2714955 RepID=UPI001408E964|nr:hypothetical protein [Motilibacter aurantiacus]
MHLLPAAPRRVRRTLALTAAAALTAVAAGTAAHRAAADTPALVTTVEKLTRSTAWQQTGDLALRFDAHHPQGMLRIGGLWWMSSVEILEPTVRYPTPVDGYDRTPGKGRGHLFAFDDQGELQADILLGEGAVYHPGGLDFDGESLWVPVAEYRPNSRSIVYRVDPTTHAVTEAFRVADHLGGIVHDTTRDRFVGVSWGSRTFYDLRRNGRVAGTRPNESHFVDYQDCDFLSGRSMLCTGLTEVAGPNAAIRMGGVAVVDTKKLTVGHEVPVFRWSTSGANILRNPSDLALQPDGSVRLTVVPDDGVSARMLTFTAKP